MRSLLLTSAILVMTPPAGALNDHALSIPTPPSKSIQHPAAAIILGRCHMGSCWWWQVNKTEVIRTEHDNRLVKIAVKTTDATYSDAHLTERGYPDYPPATAHWENAADTYILCSNSLPTYIVYDQKRDQFIANVPFDQDGHSCGATEGVANLYSHICHHYPAASFHIRPELANAEFILDHPEAIFNHLKSAVAF